MALIRPPITGDPQLDSWTDQLTRQINQGILPGFGGGPGGSGGGGGGSGTNGDDGNSAIYIYQRTTTCIAPTVLPLRVDYDFERTPPIAVSISEFHDWSATIPDESEGAYLWVSFRYVSGLSGVIEDQNSWDAPTLLSGPSVSVNIGTFRIVGGTSPTDILARYDGTGDVLVYPTSIGGTAGTDFARISSQFQHNQDGVDDEVKVLIATVFLGSEAADTAAHIDYRYTWMKNGSAITPDILPDTQVESPATTPNRRILIINTNDVGDPDPESDGSGEDAFTCTVEEISS